MSSIAPRPNRRIRVVLKARSGRDAAEGLRQVVAAARGAELEARVELDLRDSDLIGAARDTALSERVTREVGDTLDQLAAVVKARDDAAAAGHAIEPPMTGEEAKKTLVERLEGVLVAGGRIAVVLRAVGDIVALIFGTKR